MYEQNKKDKQEFVGANDPNYCHSHSVFRPCDKCMERDLFYLKSEFNRKANEELYLKYLERYTSRELYPEMYDDGTGLKKGDKVKITDPDNSDHKPIYGIVDFTIGFRNVLFLQDGSGYDFDEWTIEKISKNR